jgi:putative membrane protein
MHAISGLRRGSEFLARKYFILLLVNLLGLVVADQMLAGVYMAGYAWGLLAAALLTLLHMVLKPALLFFTLPLTVLSLGLSLLAVNTLIFWLAGHLLPGFTVTGLGSSIGGALIISLMGVLANTFLLARSASISGRRRVFTVYSGGNTFFRPGMAGKENRPGREKNSPSYPAPEEKEVVIDMENSEDGQWKIKD